mmetsp:Transcript_28719/g.72210  ORF Transcript_28719/g.72210 Transcript_28719/m.72210 type:complete len:754 (+) Transcript_28719:55-2316(+)|eukprot:CAMPEP_0177671294 /NCGR_PEP_ID=MMETSP0447-20121125/24618_1 /TAXON_ID=0 /ORGANISM="Stygamoeba regulata, Strain BSH-02190019" /LENGTH=753 /DNA_ID=CAMNT_0019178659 /DNA_START=309 /DNA_END=2570 /DNA_ORIENTATION=+
MAGPFLDQLLESLQYGAVPAEVRVVVLTHLLDLQPLADGHKNDIKTMWPALPLGLRNRLQQWLASAPTHPQTFENALVPASAGPVSKMAADARRSFMQERWLPFLRMLKSELDLVVSKAAQNFSPEKRLPSQAAIVQWVSICRKLTAEWHGRPNIAVMYEWMVEASEHSGDTGYNWNLIKVCRSPDSYVRIADGKLRKELYAASSGASKDKVEVHGLPDHNVGASAIDNTVLPNVLSNRDAKRLLVKEVLKRVFVVLLRCKQRRILRVLGLSLPVTPEALSDPARLEACGVAADSPALRALAGSGNLIADWGQLHRDDKVKFNEFLEVHLKAVQGGPSFPGLLSKREATALQLREFVSWVHANPGKVFQNNSALHRQLLLMGMWSGQISVIKRTEMEGYTIHRYLPFEWERSVDLIRVDESTGKLLVARPVASAEWSRLRKNAFPYADSHGMGISSGGIEEAGSGLLHELGTAAPTDEGAKMGNWLCNDIEKVVQEALVLNPPVSWAHILPGEDFHEVAQNPKAGSSIGATQHTQIARSHVKEWPLYSLSHAPVQCQEVGGLVDLVQVGDHADAFFLKITFPHSQHAAVCKLLKAVRCHILSSVSAVNVDFNVLCTSNGTGALVLIFTPIANISKDKGVGKNPFTGEVSSQYGLPVPAMDSGSGRGSIMCTSEEEWAAGLKGAVMLEGLYNLTRVPNAFKLTYECLQKELASPPPAPKAKVIKPFHRIPTTPKRPVFQDMLEGMIAAHADCRS